MRDCRARLFAREGGHVLYLFPENQKGYVSLNSDLSSDGPEDYPAVCGMISDRGNGDCSARELKTPEDFNEFFAEALAFLARNSLKGEP